MARRTLSAGLIAVCAAALTATFTFGCQGGGGRASAPAIISGSPADPVAQPPLAAGVVSEKPAAPAPAGGTIVVSASPSIDISPPDLSVTVDASSVNLRRVFEDLGPDEIHDRYFKGRADGLRLNGVARLLKAGR